MRHGSGIKYATHKKPWAKRHQTTGIFRIFPGAGTRQANLLEGLNLVYRTEKAELKVNELNLLERFSKIAGVTK